MKRNIKIIIATLFLALFSTPIYAEENTFKFVLSVDGKNEKNVETGDVITVSLKLSCSNNKECLITSFQDEIYYDSEFYELVEGSQIVTNGIFFNDIDVKDRYRAFYMNFVSFDGPIILKGDSLIGSFQLKVLAETGVSRIKNQNCVVTNEFGDEYVINQNKEDDVVIIRSNTIEVHLKDDQDNFLNNEYVDYQKPMKKPNVLNADGQVAENWYSDQDGNVEWNFDDNVEENMSIYGHDWSDKEIMNHTFIYVLLISISIITIIFLLLFKRRNKKNK